MQGYNPKCELIRDFCTMHLPRKFHHPMFTRSEVILLTNERTNRQTPLKTSNALRYVTTQLGNNKGRLMTRRKVPAVKYVVNTNEWQLAMHCHLRQPDVMSLPG